MTARRASSQGRTRPRLGCRGAGFTLIEVMVALAIVAIALAAGSRAASSVVDTSQRLSDVVLAQWCADNALVNLRVSAQWPPVGKTPFTCVQMGRTFKGTIKATPTPNPNFRRVDASVANEDDRQLLTISTVLAR